MTHVLEQFTEEEEKPNLGDLEKMGIEVPEELRDALEKIIAERGDDFFRDIEDGNELYWTFSPFGEEIIKSGKVVPGSKAPTQYTDKHSGGVHFVRPGIFGKDALEDLNYVRYARAERRAGYGAERIRSPFGIAIAFPASYLASVTPYRQMPRNRPENSQNLRDVVFFKSDKRATAEDYEYDLREAYIFVVWRHDTWEDQRFERIWGSGRENIRKLHSEGKDPRHEIAKLICESYGYSEEWIGEHVISLPYDEVTGGLSKEQWEFGGIRGPGGQDIGGQDKRDIAEIALASRKIHSKMGEGDSVVAPIEIQRDKAFEHTDESFLVQQSQFERLVVLPIKRDAEFDNNLEPNQAIEKSSY